MNPNDNYYKFFNIELEENNISVFKVAYSAVIEKFFKVHCNAFGKDSYEDIKIMVEYLVQGGNL